MQKKLPKQQDESATLQPRIDDVLKRMLSSPPKQHKDEKHPRPAGDPAQKKPAE